VSEGSEKGGGGKKGMGKFERGLGGEMGGGGGEESMD
jgi:hypothetical protein